MPQDNKILLYTLEYPPFKGGVANYYGNIVKHYPDDILVLQQKAHWLFGFWRLYRAVKKNNIKTIFVGHILPLGTVTYYLAKFLKIKYVVFLHGMDLAMALKVSRKKKLAIKILNNAEKIIAANSYVAKMAREIVQDDNKVSVVNPGISSRVTHNAQRVAELIKKYNLQNKKVLLSVGRLVERKGFDKVIEAMKDIVKEFPELVYVLIGSGELEKDIRYWISDIKENVRLITDSTDEELQVWYEICKVFIMPARDIDGDFEGFGIVYLEANAHGKPVIAGDRGGVRDAVENGVNGLLVNPESTKEISKAIIRLFADESLRKKLGEQGRERVKDFVWEKQIEKIKKKLPG